jgi:dihydrofolate reductase
VSGRNGGENRKPQLVLVVAVAENGVIGRGGKLPWHVRSDLRRFRAATMGKPVVMGRKTYDSIGKPLDGRTNIVVTRDPNFAAPGVVVATSVESALAVAHGDALRRGANEIAIIGGADIFAQTMPLAHRIVFTRVHLKPTGDTMFPPVDATLWREVERSEHAPGAGDDAGYTVIAYERTTDANAAGAPSAPKRQDPPAL